MGLLRQFPRLALYAAAALLLMGGLPGCAPLQKSDKAAPAPNAMPYDQLLVSNPYDVDAMAQLSSKAKQKAAATVPQTAHHPNSATCPTPSGSE